MTCFNSVPVDCVGTGCGLRVVSLPVYNWPSHTQPDATATFGNKGEIPRFNSANTSGCNVCLLSFTDKTQQLTS